MKFLNDEEMRVAFGKKARELAVSRYSSEFIIPQYIKFYEEILAQSEKRQMQNA
jgi:glycosyltransferase involved in cell wall biosynthesis